MAHRVNQGASLASIIARSRRGKVSQKASAGIVPSPAPGPNPIDPEVAAQMNSNQLLALMLAELRGLNERNETRNPQVGLSPTHDHVIQKVGVDAVLQNHEVRVIPAYRITFLNWPKPMCAFDVRIQSLDAPKFRITRSGNRIDSPTPFDRIYIDASPLTKGGAIELHTGELEITQVGPVRSPFDLVYQQDEQSNYTANRTVDDTIDCRLVDNSKLISAVGTTDYYTAIPQNWCMRLWGNIQALKPSSTSVGRVALNVMKDGTGTVLRRFAEMLIPESGSLVRSYDTGFVRYSEVTKLQCNIIDLGVAGNSILVTTNLELVAP